MATEAVCTRAPAGWRCTRGIHDGPCAAVPDEAYAMSAIQALERVQRAYSLRVGAILARLYPEGGLHHLTDERLLKDLQETYTFAFDFGEDD